MANYPRLPIGFWTDETYLLGDGDRAPTEKESYHRRLLLALKAAIAQRQEPTTGEQGDPAEFALTLAEILEMGVESPIEIGALLQIKGWKLTKEAKVA